MLKIERILCPVDFSEFSAKAFENAYSLTRHYGSKLYLEDVVQPLTSVFPYYAFPDSMNRVFSELNADAEKRLQDLAKKHTWNGLQPDFVVHNGFPVESILSSAQAKAVDLIVTGTHGRQGLDRMAMGSVTEKVLRKARCPVLAVRKPAHDFISVEKGADAVHLRKILFCTDFSEHSQRALEYALSLAMEFIADLTLLHVLEDSAASHLVICPCESCGPDRDGDARPPGPRSNGHGVRNRESVAESSLSSPGCPQAGSRLHQR